MSLDPNGAPAGYYYEAGATAYLIDPAGTFSLAGASAPTTDPAGTYSGRGRVRADLAIRGHIYRRAGATSARGGDRRPGRHIQPPRRERPTTDPAGTYSGAGAARRRSRRRAPIFRSPERPRRRRKLSTRPEPTARRARPRRSPTQEEPTAPLAPAPRRRTRLAHTAVRTH